MPRGPESPLAFKFPRRLRLQTTSADGMAVVWRADQEIENPAVQFWQDGEVAAVCYGSLILVRTTSGKAALRAIPEGQKQYEATIAGLKLDTTYHYAWLDGTKPLSEDAAELTFTTHPAIGVDRAARIWVVSDSGIGKLFQRRIHS